VPKFSEGTSSTAEAKQAAPIVQSAKDLIAVPKVPTVGPTEAFEEILNDRGDICAFSGARGVAAILEKAGCKHVKAAAHAEVAFFLNDTKDPSAEATLMGGKFYSDVWVNGGRELAHEIIKKNEKDTHDVREEARRTKKATERERRIGIVF
jgi:hypothetical protein